MTTNHILARYAQLLTGYCLEIRSGDRLFVRSTTLAEPLVREVYRQALHLGAVVEVQLDFREQGRIQLTEGSPAHLGYVSATYKEVVRDFDAYLYIRAPYNLSEERHVDASRVQLRQEAHREWQRIYSERTASRALRRNLCQYPTQAAAQEAGMSLEEYEHFVYGACGLFADDPQQVWLGRRQRQQALVDALNACRTIRYVGPGTDLTFSTEGRTWINSDGQTNMPSGEIYTSPVEDSVHGTVHFSYPAIYMGHEVEGVTLWVKDGLIERWEAQRGQAFLDTIFQMPGTRRFGEAAIGTNYDIQQFTKNILFDEKIGGTIHLAIGQSYLQAGGRNESPVHWDMISDMGQGSAIYADGKQIYADGRFLTAFEG